MKKLTSVAMSSLLGVWLAGAALAQQPESPPTAPPAAGDTETERLRDEAERARREARKARMEAERARAEAELLRMQLEGQQAVRERQPVARQRRRARRTAEFPGFHAHDGFFMRFTLGPGFGGFNSTGHIAIPGSTAVLTEPHDKGMLVGGSFSLGGSIGPGLIIHGDVWGSGHFGEGQEAYLQDVGFGVIGAGLTYYWMPENLYLTGSVGIASSVARIGPDLFHQDEQKEIGTGVGVAVTFGKEWWASVNWGIGVAVGGFFTYTEGDDIVMRQAGVKLLFSATFN